MLSFLSPFVFICVPLILSLCKSLSPSVSLSLSLPSSSSSFHSLPPLSSLKNIQHNELRKGERKAECSLVSVLVSFCPVSLMTPNSFRVVLCPPSTQKLTTDELFFFPALRPQELEAMLRWQSVFDRFGKDIAACADY